MCGVLVEAREELRAAVTSLTSRLAAEQERARLAAAAATVRDTLLQVRPLRCCTPVSVPLHVQQR